MDVGGSSYWVFLRYLVHKLMYFLVIFSWIMPVSKYPKDLCVIEGLLEG